MAAWTADFDDPIPKAGEAGLARLMAYNPSRSRTIHQNLFMRIPISMTQKWYYLRGSEDKDSEYGRIFIAVVSPLSNVTNGSVTNVVVRIRWAFEFAYPELPEVNEPDASYVQASYPNYFTDSSSDWKNGKYLTFKWHEGGNIVEFPKATPKTYYKLAEGAHCQYYDGNGDLKSTVWAVCVTESTETVMPMLAPVESEAKAKAYCNGPADQYLIGYKDAGPWVTPENPLWWLQGDKLEAPIDLIVGRGRSLRPQAVAPSSTLRVSDSGSVGQQKEMRKLVDRLLSNEGSPTDDLLGLLYSALQQSSRIPYSNILGARCLRTFVVDPVRNPQPGTSRSSESSFEVLPHEDEGRNTSEPDAV